MWALSLNPLHCWSVQVLCIVPAQRGGRCSTIHTVKIPVHSVKGCCKATSMALTSIEQKFYFLDLSWNQWPAGFKKFEYIWSTSNKKHWYDLWPKSEHKSCILSWSNILIDLLSRSYWEIALVASIKEVIWSTPGISLKSVNVGKQKRFTGAIKQIRRMKWTGR